MANFKDIFDNDFIKNSDNMWLLTLIFLLFSDSSYQSGNITINVYFNGEKVGVK